MPDNQDDLQMTDDRWDTDDLSLKEDNSGWRQRLERSMFYLKFGKVVIALTKQNQRLERSIYFGLIVIWTPPNVHLEY